MNILFITPYLPSENSGHAGAQLIYRNVVGLSEYNKITIASFIDINEEETINNLTSYGIDVFTISYPRNQKSISGKINSVFRNITFVIVISLLLIFLQHFIFNLGLQIFDLSNDTEKYCGDR